jgi:uncharacterized protein
VIAYFDTSGVIPLLVAEPGSTPAERVWAEAEHVVSVRLVYAEARAALAQAARAGRLDADDHIVAVAELDALYRQLDLIEIDDRLARRAGALAEQYALRGYDAVHLAGVERLIDADLVLVAGDQALCDAGRALGLAITDTSPHRS